jgi:hypothetical protein
MLIEESVEVAGKDQVRVMPAPVPQNIHLLCPEGLTAPEQHVGTFEVEVDQIMRSVAEIDLD